MTKMTNMKKTFAMLTILFLFSLFLFQTSFAQTNITTTTTPGINWPQIPGTLKDVYNFLSSINPFVLLIFGIILFVVSHLSKYVAIVLIIFALIQIILLLVH